MASFFPVVGAWYKDYDDQIFRVVAFDEGDSLVEIQLFEGEIDELDLDSWYASDVETIAAPEDWSGPFDEMEHDDLGYSDLNARRGHHSFRVEDIE